ncbi:MAG: DSD1 family PLP-dependent enzyme [Pseudomonadota bacterium]
MQQNAPAAPGMSEDEIDTPALIVDLDAMEANLDAMATFCAGAGVKLRAHAKTHKSPVIAHWQIARGAVGQCVQKVGEAEVLTWGGVADILVSNEIVSPQKIARIAALSNMANVALCADDRAAVDIIEDVAAVFGCRLTVLVEIDVGSARCGVTPGTAAVDLAKHIASSPNLIFGGLQSYDGAAQHIHHPEERAAHVQKAVEATRRTVELLAAAGLSCAIVGGAGTGTFALEAASEVYNEIQAGSYVFMDAAYARIEPSPPFQQSLFVLSTVMSAARNGVAVVDCGHKSVAIDAGPPLVHDWPGVVCERNSDEHGHLRVDATAQPLKVGQRLKLVPGHCDPTVDRHDWYVGVRQGRVEMVWPVAARGAAF